MILQNNFFYRFLNVFCYCVMVGGILVAIYTLYLALPKRPQPDAQNSHIICNDGKKFALEHLYDFLNVSNSKIYTNLEGIKEATILCRGNNAFYQKYTDEYGWVILLNEASTYGSSFFIELDETKNYKYKPTDLLSEAPDVFKVKIAFHKRVWTSFFNQLAVCIGTLIVWCLILMVIRETFLYLIFAQKFRWNKFFKS